MSTKPLRQAAEISEFYDAIRRYWMLLSTSARGDRSYMLNFGYWPAPVDNLYDAQQIFFQKIIGLLPEPNSTDHGLEIGCGIGGISINMLRALPSLQMTAIDISDHQLALARESANKAEVGSRLMLSQGDAMRLHLASDTFDFALCIESTFHYDDKASFFREAWRVLKPGRHLLLADITCEDASQIRYRQGNHFVSSRTYESLARDAGFAVLEVNDIGAYVYGPLHRFVAQFNRNHRIRSGKYWSVVLNNYDRLSAAGLMGYNFFLFRKLL